MFLVEGENLVREAISMDMAEDILISDDFSGVYPDIEKSEKTVFIKGNLFKRVAQTKSSQGVLATVKSTLLEKDEFVDYLKSKEGHILILDKLQDPGNIGTILRTGEAFGYVAVVLIKGTGDVFSPKVVRAAAGSVLRMKMMMAEDPRCAREVSEASGRLPVGTLVKDAISLEDYRIQDDIALVIGNEGNGISSEMSLLTEENITIPMRGDTESLNAAVACGIIMYETMKGRQ